MKSLTKLWLVIIVLVFLTPLGLLLPYCLKASSAWGEWSVAEIQQFLGYAPSGLKKLSGVWKAPLHGYAFKGWGEKGIMHLVVAYLAAAIIGTCLTVALAWFVGKLVAGKKR